ncbi:hypothetical protein AVEN_203961-1, partial [Araneus ventricosus]
MKWWNSKEFNLGAVVDFDSIRPQAQNCFEPPPSTQTCNLTLPLALR